MQPPVAITHAHGRQVPQANPQFRTLRAHARIPVTRARKPEPRTRPTFTHLVRHTQFPHQQTAAPRLQTFFDNTSCSIFLSRLRSATSCFSFRFSSSSCFSRRNSDTPSPAK